MRIASLGFLAAGVVLSTTACGVRTTVGTDFEPGVNFDRFRTFAWDYAAIPRTPDVRLENNPFFQAHLFEAVERELATRGIRHDESSPDLLAHYHLSVEDHVEVYQEDPESGYPTPYGEGAGTYRYERGTFVLHFVDAKMDQDLWFAWAQGDISKALDDPEKMRAWVDEAVALIFEEFPIRTTP